MYRWQQRGGGSCNHVQPARFTICGEALPVHFPVRVADDKVKPPGAGKKVNVCTGRAEHTIRVGMCTACEVGIKRHHIEKYRSGTLPRHCAGKHVQFRNNAIVLAEERNELVGVTVVSQFEEQGEKFFFYAVDVHG